MHALVLDSTKMTEQRQTASIALGRGSTKTYSTGDIIDGTYRLLWLLGTGGMGVVFHCQHIMLGKEYALKILAADSITLDSWNRFQSEAKALARLHHPGVVSIHNMGIDNQQCPYYVMDLLSGQSLAQIIEQKHRLPVDQAVKIFIQLADALDAAHQQDIIHRDIKPSNVMVYQESGKERVKIVDFGIARLNTGRHNYILKTEVESQNQTMAGAVFGTPYYMSPEQGAGQPLDHRSDIYSLGCALFESLTGIPPLCGSTAMETIMMHQTEEAPLISSVYPDGKFPKSIEAAIAKMLCKNPDQRYQNMKQVNHDLTRILEGKAVIQTVIKADAKPRGQSTASQASPKSKQNRIQDNSLALIVAIFAFGTVALACGFWLATTLATNNVASEANKKALQAKLQKDDTRFLSHSPSSTPLIKQAMQGQSGFVTLTKDQDQLPIKRFDFPYYIGYIRANENPLQKAVNTIDVPAAAKIYLYLHGECANLPDLCDRFGKDNIQGLELISTQPERVINQVKDWNKLEHLSFFHTARGLRGDLSSPLSVKHLAMIDKLTALHSLGLSGVPPASALDYDPEEFGLPLKGSDIANMRLLSKLSALYIKDVPMIQPLLSSMPQHSNIKELTLVELDITDRDLKLLETSKGLQTLRIFRCPKLTKEAALTLCQIKGLKHFYTDEIWPLSTQNIFKGHKIDFNYEHYDFGREALFGPRRGPFKQDSLEFPRAPNLHYDRKKHAKQIKDALF